MALVQGTEKDIMLNYWRSHGHCTRKREQHGFCARIRDQYDSCTNKIKEQQCKDKRKSAWSFCKHRDQHGFCARIRED
jgi:ribosomal protein L34